MIKSFIFFLWLCLSFPALSQDIDRENTAIVKAQLLIESGEFDKAKLYLSKVTYQYKNSDVLYALFGQALYESKQIQQAEKMFMIALDLNPLNLVAMNYIKQIRDTRDATTSTTLKKIHDLSWDKVGDLVTMAFAFLLAAFMKKYIDNYAIWRFTRKSKRLFLQGDYDDFTDLLELQVTNHSLAPLRKSIAFFLEHKTAPEIIAILEQHVVDENHFKVIERMVGQHVKRIQNN